jgi:hypothetical protein
LLSLGPVALPPMKAARDVPSSFDVEDPDGDTVELKEPEVVIVGPESFLNASD